MASLALRSFDLVTAIVSYQEGLPQDLAVVQRLADAVQLTPGSEYRYICEDQTGYLAHIPARFASSPYLQRYPHRTTKLPHNSLFVSPRFYDRALALHLSVVEGNVALVQQWLRWDASLCTSATLELAAAASQGPILHHLFEQFPALATPKMMDLVAMSGNLELLMWLHEAGAVCSTAAMDGAAMNGHYDSVVFLHSARTEGCTMAAATAATVNGHASIARFLLEQRTEGVDPTLQFIQPHREHVTHSVRGETQLEAVDLVAARVQLSDAGLTVIVEKGGLATLQYIYARGYLKRMTKQVLELAVAKQDHAILRYILGCVDRENPRPPSDDEWLPTDTPDTTFSFDPLDPSPFDRWEGCKVMELAAFNGDLTSLELLHKSRLRVGSERAIAFAAYRNHLHVLDWLLKNRRDGCGEDAMALAAAAGHFDVVRWLHEVYGLWRTHAALASAAYIGHMAMATYLLNVPTGGVDNQSDPADAASICQFTFAMHYRCNSSVDYARGSAMHWAASQGHSAMLELLTARGYEVPPTALGAAAANGHAQIVRHLHERHGGICDFNSVWNAVRKGQVDTVAYVLSQRCWERQQDFGPHQDIETAMYMLLVATARSGSLDILALVCDSFQLPTGLPARISERMMVRAASNGHLDMLQHLHDAYGFGWTPMVQEAARPNVASLVWLVVHGLVAPLLVLCCPRDPNQPFLDALVARVLRSQTALSHGCVRFNFNVYGRLQRLVFRPTSVVDTPNVKGLWYDGCPSKRNWNHNITILYIHGGGFVVGSATTQSCDIIQPLLQALRAIDIGARVFSLEYDLAPEFKYPHQLEQTVAAYEWLRAATSGPILVVGDSAGGNLAALLLQHIVRCNLPRPVGAILLSPWVDVAGTAPSYTRNAATDVFRPSTITSWRDLYAAPEDLTRASPLFHSLDNLPPLMVVYGGYELMEDDIRAFVAKAKTANVDVAELCHPHKLHNYPAMLRYTAAAADAYAAMALFVARHFQK
ncbi:hypothetical protein SDRG_09770 [Saprolegnia diclina VS20]|uniref:Alpha/beta hydrolase fold-3 domain-containing protein n=1 Tax=Saprolegnia diclina (strain VS20) TaxID=1156394 RepID=T0RJ97_SAPDV|nr:hypothetical protein SDRG_09770 [Saprolegnia diclina VS20]EQC32443.1 hypothetical protein SDRG_09770 [Saprolegnia diclina VS20]|eukprot:XP_008613944.1 hypothetical protein SDRG_09770 [Saprolegnia diclina VS20]